MFQNPLTPVIKNLIIVNVAVFVIIFIMQRANVPFYQYFPLYNLQSTGFQPFQFVSSMFTHFSIGHIFFNCLTLYFFGPMIEHTIGPKKTLIAYIAGGLFSAVIFFLVYSFIIPSNFALLGASGAVYTIIVLCAMYYPNAKAGLLFIPIQIPLKILVAIFITIDILFMSGRVATGIAHLAHLGGALMGFILYIIWNKR